MQEGRFFKSYKCWLLKTTLDNDRKIPVDFFS